VVKLGRFELTGFLGWLFWSLVHIYFLIEARDRFIVAFTWLWEYVTFQRGVSEHALCANSGQLSPPLQSSHGNPQRSARSIGRIPCCTQQI
jgi:hypothetical protein